MSDTTAPIADSAPLSVDEAAGLLGTREPEEVTTEDAPVEAVEPESDAEPTAEDLEAPEEASEEVEEAEIEDAPAPILAPKSWDAEARAVFATIPREAQQVIAAREAERDLSTQKAVQESSAARKTAEETVQSVTQLRAATEQVLQRAAETFKGKWDNVDWDAWFATDAQAALIGERAMKAEQTELTRLQGVNQAQAQVEKQAFNAKKVEDLKTLAPDLLDPKTGPEKIAALETYIINETGIDRQFLETLDARVINLARKAMKYDAAIANRSNKPPAPVRAAVRPAAAQTVRTPQREAQTALNRLSQTGSIDDAVALLNMRK